MDKYKVSTPVGGTYSRHKSLSEGLKHVGEVLTNRGSSPTVKEAIEHGFSLSKEKSSHKPSGDRGFHHSDIHKAAEEMRMEGKGSHDPKYSDKHKNK